MSSEDDMRAIEAKLDEVLALLKEIMRRDYWDPLDKKENADRGYGKAALDHLEAAARAWQARPEGEP